MISVEFQPSTQPSGLDAAAHLIVFNSVQPTKIALAIVVTLDGITISTKFVHPLKAFRLIVVIVLLIMMYCINQ